MMVDEANKPAVGDIVRFKSGVLPIGATSADLEVVEVVTPDHAPPVLVLRIAGSPQAADGSDTQRVQTALLELVRRGPNYVAPVKTAAETLAAKQQSDAPAPGPAVGDRAWLRSGSPAMTIVQVGDGHVDVTFWDGHGFVRTMIPIDALSSTQVDPPAPPEPRKPSLPEGYVWQAVKVKADDAAVAAPATKG